jgi:hypothetical protein
MPTRAPHHPACARCIVRIDVHGSKDRAKDASPEHMRRSLVPASGACALWRMRDGVPLLGALRTSAVIGAPHGAGGYPHHPVDRPRSPFRRRPAKSGAFQKTRMPFTVTSREGVDSRRDCSLRPSRRLSRSRRPHVLHRVVEGVLIGHCKVTVRSPAGRDDSRVQTPLQLVGTAAPGTDDPSAPPSSTDSAVDEG